MTIEPTLIINYAAVFLIMGIGFYAIIKSAKNNKPKELTASERLAYEQRRGQLLAEQEFGRTK